MFECVVNEGFIEQRQGRGEKKDASGNIMSIHPEINEWMDGWKARAEGYTMQQYTKHE